MFSIAMNSLFISAALFFCYTDARRVGHLPFGPSTRIVGGYSIDINEAPYQVSLTIFGQHFCGASIISPTVIITAAHCVEGKEGYIEVRVGSSRVNSGGSTKRVKDSLIHPNYNKNTSESDLALLYLHSPISLTDNAAIVRLPHLDQSIPDGSLTVVTGWGSLRTEGNVSIQLQKIVIPIINQEDCRIAFSELNDVADNMLCAGVLGKKDSCRGDSGGPLVFNGYLFGVSSWGPTNCADPNYPGVYTRIPKFVKWIEENMNR